MNNALFDKINTLAQEAKYGRIIKPVEEWKIPYTLEKIGEFEIKLIKKLTVAETAILNQSQKVLNLIKEAHNESLKLLMAEVGQQLGLEYYHEAVDLFRNPTQIAEKIMEKEIAVEEVEKWEETLNTIHETYDTALAQQNYNFLAVTFFLWMRCSEDWTEEDTELLSQEEFEYVLKLIEKEKDPEPIHIEPLPLELKK